MELCVNEVDTDNIDLNVNSIDLDVSFRESVNSESMGSDDSTTRIDAECDINDDSSVGDVTYTCDGCGDMITASPNALWYRCTNCCDIDVCPSCYSKDIHDHHKVYLQKFIAPYDWNAPYCDACGFSFNDPDGTLFKCQMCEDYCLCRRCQNNLLHLHHSKYLKEVCVEQYIKDIV